MTQQLRDTLQLLRKRINKVDWQVLKALERRKKIVIEIGRVKEKLWLDLYQGKRKHEMLLHKQKMAQNLHLESGFIKELREKIHDWSLGIQHQKSK